MRNREELTTDVQSPSLRLELDGSSDMKNLTRLVRSNVSVTDVDVCVNDSLTEKPIREIAMFFGDLGTILTKLRKIELYPGEGNYNCFPIEALSRCLCHAACLESIYVYHLEVTGTDEQFEEFAGHLGSCSHMKEFCFFDCQLSETQSNAHSFDPIAKTLGGMPDLEVVALWARENGFLGRLSSDALEALCLSPNLQRLMLLRFGFNHDEVDIIFGNLASNTSLKRLNISCDLGVKNCLVLCNMLEKNTTIEKLKIEVDILDSTEGCISIADGLSKNNTLDYFKLNGQTESCNRKITEAFSNMLQINFSLETLVVGDAWDPRMDLYLKLNQTGKRRLLREPGATRGDWVDAIISTSSDHDCIFYFISMNPALCFDAIYCQ